jgi:integrase
VPIDQQRRPKLPTGIRERHQRACATLAGKTRCSCAPSFEALVTLGKTGERRRQTFSSLADAKAWRVQMLAAKTQRRLRAPRSVTLRDASERFVEGMRSGTIANRSGEAYKPSVIRSYEQALNRYVLPDLGGRKLGDVTSGDLQRLIERMRGGALSASTIRNALNPLQAIYRRAVTLGDVSHNPTRDVTLPVIRGRRAHGGDAADALRLIATVPERDRCIWALAFFAGLRLGELRALRWSDVDEEQGVINVSRSWDDREGEIVTKSAAGERAIPIIAALRPHLAAQRDRCPWAPDGLVLGNSAREPFHYNGLYRRSAAAWSVANLEPITPHQARHSFASLLIASGAEVKTVTDIMGHTSVRQSFDRYGHLFDDARTTTAARLDSLIAAADTATRLAQLENA